jgi:hypothetical protein
MLRSSAKDPVSRNLACAFRTASPSVRFRPGESSSRSLVEPVRGLVQAQSARGDDGELPGVRRWQAADGDIGKEVVSVDRGEGGSEAVQR